LTRRINLAREEFKEEKRLRSKLFDLLIKKKVHERSRLAIVVPKTNVKLATKRNSIRRVLSQAARPILEQGDYDILCIVKEDFSKMSPSEITSHFLKLTEGVRL